MRLVAYVTRLRAACGWLYTTPGSPTVHCACCQHEILDDAPNVPSLPFTEAEFAQAVATEVGLPVEDLEIVRA